MIGGIQVELILELRGAGSAELILVRDLADRGMKELEWRYIRSGITTYLDDVVYECMVGDATLDEGTEEIPDTPDDPTLPDDPTDPDDGIGGTESPDKDGTNKEDSMPDEGWVEEDE